MVTTEERLGDLAIARPDSAPESRNLLDNKVVAAVVRSRWYPGILRWPTALVFALVVYELLLGPVAAHNNFGTAATWVLWWPVMVRNLSVRDNQ